MQDKRLQIRLYNWLTALSVILFVTGCSSSDSGISSPSSPAEFDLRVATELARLNLHAYQQLDDYLANRVFSLPTPYQLEAQLFTFEEFAGESLINDDTVPIAFIATANDTIYVVFRGTKTISEWISDATYSQVSYPFLPNSGLTHRGITTIYQTIHNALVEVVIGLTATNDYTTLYITGHSLGGAMAVLAAPTLRDLTRLDPILYNFASPRVGNPAFRQAYDTEMHTSWRLVNQHDIIPDLPPPLAPYIENGNLLEFNYQHVPNARHIIFGNPLNGLDDALDIGSNHDMCHYYNALCDQLNTPAACKAEAAGTNGCNL